MLVNGRYSYMAPARAKLVFLSFLVLVLLITGTLWFVFKDSPESMPSYAPDQAKPPAAYKPPSPMESVQQPTAEVLSKRVVEYHIDTTLDPDSRVIKGTQTLTWTHPGKKR